MLALLVALATALLLHPTLATSTTTYYIDALPAFSTLATCAQTAVSNIINDGVWGCGAPYSSYSCFCTASSARFAAMIPAHVVSGCPAALGQEQAGDASRLFGEYCGLQSAAEARATAMGGAAAAATAAATQGAGASVGTPVATAGVVAPAAGGEDTRRRAVAIAVGVAVPVVVVAAFVGGMLLLVARRRGREQMAARAEEEARDRATSSRSSQGSSSCVFEANMKHAVPVAEAAGSDPAVEVDGSQRVELDATGLKVVKV